MSEVPNALLQYGVLGIAVLVFGFTIVALFRRSDARDKLHKEEIAALDKQHNDAAEKMVAERTSYITREIARDAASATRDVQLRAEFEAKMRVAMEEHAKELRDLQERARAREDQVRAEFTELMETVTGESTKSAQSFANVMDKIVDRIPRARG